MATMSVNSRLVFDYVSAHEDENITAKDIAAALNLTDKQVNGIVTSAFQKKGLMYRQEELVPGGVVKYIHLTEEGRAFDPDAVAAE